MADPLVPIEPTADQLAARTAAPTDPTTPAPAPINRTVVPDTSAAETYANTFKAPQTAAQIAESKRVASQGSIDAINQKADAARAAAQQTGQQRLSIDDAQSVLSGLMGSTEAGRVRKADLATNDKEMQAVNAQKATDLTNLYSKINDDADTEARAQIQDANASSSDILARRDAARSNALDSVKQLAKGGLVDFEAFKSNPQNAKAYNYALDAAGGSEDALKAIFMANRPVDQLVGSPTRVGDHFVQGYQNPLTGKVSYESIQVPGLGQEYSSFQKLGDNLVAVPDNWDGDVNKLKTIKGEPSQSDLLDNAYKQAQITHIGIEDKKTLSDINANGPPEGYNGEFGATIKLAANTGGTNVQRSAITQSLQQFVAAGDYPSAYAQIVQATGAGLKGAAATNFQQQNNSLGVLSDLKTAIQAYANAGGDTNIFKGKVDDIQTKIGQLETDPKYAALASQLTIAFQNYRLQMTGAAFSTAESAEYASVLPDKGNSLDLNLAKLDGAQKYLNSSVESSIKSVVGQGGVNIKQKAEQTGQSDTTTSSSSDDAEYQSYLQAIGQ